MTRLPDVLVLGAMKCATSTLHEQLGRQPGVFMSIPKEPNFFSDDDVWARGLGWYGRLFDDAPDGALCGESSTHATMLPDHPRTVERMVATFGDRPPRFVYVMRHPVERLVSHHVHDWTERRAPRDLGRAVDERPALVDYGLYARQLRPYLEAFGKERVLPVFFERLAARPRATLERVARFLGVNGKVTWHEEDAVRNASAERLRASPLRDALLTAPGSRALRHALVPRALREKAKGLWRLPGRGVLDPATRARVEERFDEDLARLGDLLGLELSCARFAEVARVTDAGWA